MWRARWSEREKQRPQWWHLKGLAPVCFLKWRVSSSDRANLHSQPSHEHRYGFSPVEGEEGLLEGARGEVKGMKERGKNRSLWKMRNMI